MACELCFISLLLTVAVCIADNPCNKLKTEYGYVCVCNSTYCDEISPPETLPTGQFHFYYTSDDTPGFNHETGNFKEQVFQPYDFKYTVNSSKHFQTIRGFGGAFTDLFGVEFDKLSYNTQENLIKSFFSEDGIEYTFCRVVLGSSDFSVRHYSYVPNYDPSLESFSLTEDDYIYKIAPIKRALSVTKKGVSFLGSTWTAPSWMKINNDPSAGYLKQGYRQLWADYHIKMLDAFKAEGIEFWGLTTGNEPVTLLSVKIVPCLVMFPEQQREWIIKNLGPSLKKANYDTKIIIMDDMRVYTSWYMNTIFRDRRAKEFVSGVGLHWYTDLMMSPTVMDEMHKKYPDQEILYTETSINVIINIFVKSTDPNMVAQYFTNVNMEDSVTRLGSWPGATFYANNIIENLQHWVTTYVEWNLGLNLKGGPNLLNSTCDASVLINVTADEFYKQPTFYVMGHFSKFIHPKSVIIEVHPITDNSSKFYETTTVPPVATTKSPYPVLKFNSNIEYVGALNPDGSHSIVFHNPKSSSVDIIVHDPERGYALLVLKAKSINTLVYW